MSDLLIMGVEAGTARVDVAVADLEGAPAGRGRSGSGNPNGLPLPDVAAHLAEAVGLALAGLDPLAVRAVVLGTQGITRFQRGESAARLAAVWREAGLACPVTVVADAVTAFAAGTAQPCGTVLIAGAGAMAARVEHEQVTARVDGNGWLVGDDGSGFWIGRQAVRAVFAALDGRGEDTLLRDAVLSTVTQGEVPAGREECLSLLRDAVYDGPPVALAALAPLVPAAAEAGDRVAHRILRRAVDLLVDAAEPLLGGGTGGSARARGGAGGREGGGTAEFAEGKPQGDPQGEPLVLAGSLMSADGPIRREVRRRLADRHGRDPVLARPGAGGALWLAARRIDRGFGPSAHALFTALGSER